MHGGEEPELSNVGQAQARALKAWVDNITLPRPTELWVSPRVRAQQTFAPLAESLNLKMHVMRELDERPRSETPTQFHHRVGDTLTRASQRPGTVFLCSHMDWLDESLSLIVSDEALTMDGNPLWAPGAFLGLESFQNDVWKVLRKGQLQSW